MKKIYKKLLDNCFISKNETRNITALIRFRKGYNEKWYAEVLIMDEFNFRFTLGYVIEKCEEHKECSTYFMLDSAIIGNSTTFDNIISDYWQETLCSIENLMMKIYYNEIEDTADESI